MSNAKGQILATFAIFGALSIPLLTGSCNEEDTATASVAFSEFKDTGSDETVTTYLANEDSSPSHEEIVIEVVQSVDEDFYVQDPFEGTGEVYVHEESLTSYEQEATLVVELDDFNEAFGVARATLGPGKEWIWYANNITYTTYYAEEKAENDSLNDSYWTESDLASGSIAEHRASTDSSAVDVAEE